MKNKKKDIFKKVIKQAEIDKPTVDFTDLVMIEVMAETRHETIINPALKNLLQRQAVESPPADFTANVMARIDLSSQIIADKPVITKKAGFVIVSVIILSLILLFLKGVSKSIPQTITYRDKLSGILNHIITISPLGILTLIVVSMLLLIDYFINEQILNQNNNPV